MSKSSSGHSKTKGQKLGRGSKVSGDLKSHKGPHPAGAKGFKSGGKVSAGGTRKSSDGVSGKNKMGC